MRRLTKSFSRMTEQVKRLQPSLKFAYSAFKALTPDSLIEQNEYRESRR